MKAGEVWQKKYSAETVVISSIEFDEEVGDDIVCFWARLIVNGKEFTYVGKWDHLYRRVFVKNYKFLLDSTEAIKIGKKKITVRFSAENI